jgi:hypothetical protein
MPRRPPLQQPTVTAALAYTAVPVGRHRDGRQIWELQMEPSAQGRALIAVGAEGLPILVAADRGFRPVLKQLSVTSLEAPPGWSL